jgi:hypothetical protein
MAKLSRSRITLSALVLLLAAPWAQAADEGVERAVKTDDNTFKCITQMTPVRHFYVDNLSGNLQGTVAAAEKGRGDLSGRFGRTVGSDRNHGQTAERLQSNDP